jgi:hypothetical protein
LYMYLNTPRFGPDDAFNAFLMWLDESVGPRHKIAFWGNGAGFDCNLMHNAAQLLGAEWHDARGDAKPGFWPHWNDRCFRTMKGLSRETGNVFDETHKIVTAKSLEPKFEGTPHVAIDDAIHKARWLQAICDEFDVTL